MARKPEWVLNLGTYSKKTKLNKSQPGLDVARAAADSLENKGLIGTVDCCTYYPLVPSLLVADRTAPTEAEMKNVPIGGMFKAYEDGAETTFVVWIKIAADSAFDIGDNE